MRDAVTEQESVLFYWHDMWLPHSRFLVEALHDWLNVGDLTICGPAVRLGAASIFAVKGPEASRIGEHARELKTKSYRWRETVCVLSEWRRVIKQHKPNIIVVCDEALSLNVLFAGLVNLIYGEGLVLFYGFENIVQRPSWKSFLRNPNLLTLHTLIRKAVRTVLVDRLFMPLRRRIVHGGLVSYEECRAVVRAYRWTPPMTIQWWPVNTRVFTKFGPRADFGLGGAFTVGFVGRFVPEKGVADLLQALAELDSDVSLVLIGDGPDKDLIAEQIRRLGLSERCRVLPPQNAEDLAASYRAMDVVVLPSRATDTWKEQYGRVLVEAQLCGTRTAGSDVGAIPIVVGDSRMIFPAGDVGAIAETIRKARANVESPCQAVSPPTADQFLSAWLRLAHECRTHQKVSQGRR